MDGQEVLTPKKSKIWPVVVLVCFLIFSGLPERKYHIKRLITCEVLP